MRCCIMQSHPCLCGALKPRVWPIRLPADLPSCPPTPSFCSPQCRERELRLAILQVHDVRLQPQLMAACEGEMAAFCEGVEAGAPFAPSRFVASNR